MSEENANVVRDFYEVLNERLAAYWSDPEQPLKELPGLQEVFDRLDPEVEWAWPLSPETFRGRERVLQAVSDWLDTVSDWRVEIKELIEGSRDRVLLIGHVVARGKGSGTPVNQPIFTAVTVRNGKVARIEDHTERAKAVEAAGLRSSEE
jgi:ketosteroid isomerase-like protein